MEFKENFLLNQKQNCQHLTPGHRCEAKGVIVYPGASEWFGRKNSWPSMAIMTVYIYRAVFYVLLLKNVFKGLSKMATKSTNTNFSLSACTGDPHTTVCVTDCYFTFNDILLSMYINQW